MKGLHVERPELREVAREPLAGWRGDPGFVAQQAPVVGGVRKELGDHVRTLAFVLDCILERPRSPREQALEIARTVRAMDRDARAFGAISDDELGRRIARALATDSGRERELRASGESSRSTAEEIVRELRA